MKELYLYLVTGRYDLSEQEFLQVITEACQHGVTMVQLREKELSTRAFYELAKKVKAVTDHYHVPLIINDRVDICLAVDAAGVHIGDDELPVPVTRKLIGEKILGVSAKTVVRGIEAKAEGADYLGVGAIFPTKTKESDLTSVTTLKDIIQTVGLPVVAIGGIKEGNLATFKETSVDGVAIVSEIMLANDVSQKVTRITNKLREVVGEENK